MHESPTVSIIDDDQQARESLAAVIQSLNLGVECYASGQEFLDNYSPARPGCIVLDLRMPDMSGLEVIRELSARKINTPIIMISGHGDIPAAVTAMQAGAVDFLEKPYRSEALVESVRRAIELNARIRQAEADRNVLLERFASLTPDEKNVLQLTAEGKPDKAIATRLDLSLRTIQLRRASLMRKLVVRSRPELIRLAQVLEQPPVDG
jgi:two-component system response regulator FixJ